MTASGYRSVQSEYFLEGKEVGEGREESVMQFSSRSMLPRPSESRPVSSCPIEAGGWIIS